MLSHIWGIFSFFPSSFFFFFFWAAAAKGSMTYAFSHMGNFLLLFFSSFFVRPSPPRSNPSLEAQIPAVRPKS